MASLTKWSTQARGDPLCDETSATRATTSAFGRNPEPVRRGDEEFVIWRKASHAAVRLGGHADGVGHLVADAARHGEARHVRVGQPDARRPDDSVVVLEREDAAAAALYSLFFLGRFRFVVRS